MPKIHEAYVNEQGAESEGWESYANGPGRRALDLAVASAAVALLGAPAAAVALANTIDHNGKPLFRQQRLGRAMLPFMVYKFRTFAVDRDPAELISGSEVPDATTFGRELRRSGWDEFPQVLNVIRGDMSIVGPRPRCPAVIENYEKVVDEERYPGLLSRWKSRVSAVKPGFIDYGALFNHDYGIHGDEELPMRLHLESWGIEHASPRTDLQLIGAMPAIVYHGLLSRPSKGKTPAERAGYAPEPAPAELTEPEFVLQ